MLFIFISPLDVLNLTFWKLSSQTTKPINDNKNTPDYYTPHNMADTTQTAAFPLGTVSYSDGGGGGDGSGVDNAGGASGSSSGGINISHGAFVAIIIVVVLVAVFGSR